MLPSPHGFASTAHRLCALTVSMRETGRGQGLPYGAAALHPLYCVALSNSATALGIAHAGDKFFSNPTCWFSNVP